MISLARLAAVALADVRSRLRRPGVAVLVAGAAIGASLLIPDPRAGGVFLRVGAARALYTSSALAVGTASLLPLVIGFFGFYVVSNALGRDVETRTAFLVASTPASNLEYLLGKFAGNAALLLAVSAGFMASGMAMQVVRGEGPVEPLVWLSTYALLALPALLAIAALALAFECVPFLSGRAGDVVYFLAFNASIPLSVQPWRSPPAGRFHVGWLLDFTGVAFLMEQVRARMGDTDFAIGNSRRAIEPPPVLFPGLDAGADSFLRRAATLAVPFALLLLALLFFRRFDPARVRVRGARRSWKGLAEALARRTTGRLLAFVARFRPEAPATGASFRERVLADVALTFQISPLLPFAALAFALLALALPGPAVRRGLLPVLFALLPLFLSEIATRDARSGTSGLLFAAPGTRDGFVVWKVVSSLVSGLSLTAVPAAALLASRERAGVAASVLVATVVAATAAVLFGIATGTPKTFLALFLATWYLAINDKGATPGLDVFGFWSRAGAGTLAAWLAAAAAAVAVAEAAHRLRVSRAAG